MKLGVIGPDSTANVVRCVVEEHLPNVSLSFRCSEFFEAAALSAQSFQQEGEVDAILFTGPTNYAYALRRVLPTIPWGHLPHNRSSLLGALLKAMALHHSDLTQISVDRYTPHLIREVLTTINIHDPQIIKAEIDFEEPHFEEKLLQFHRDNYHSGRASICLTSMEHIAGPLEAEGIPCVRIYPSSEAVQEQIYHLQMMAFSHKENQGQFAMIGVQFDFVFDKEEDLLVRDWNKMTYQNEFRQMIYTVAHQLEAAVFESGGERFFLATNRNMLLNVFLKTSTHRNLLQFGRRSPDFRIWVGMGLGTTMLEAHARTTMAMNHALADAAGNSYLVENEHQLSALEEDISPPLPQYTLEYLSKLLHMGDTTLIRLGDIIRTQGDVMTSADLAAHLNITPRSTNRMILHLEDAGFVSVVGKQSWGTGRPARILKFTLPDILLT